MQEWFYTHYDIVKDFAGPAVTMFAALVAASITWFFARAQYRVAATQKNIALDKLKFDVFERRYQIYSAAKELCQLLLGKGNVEDAEFDRMYALFVTLDEARFYFDPSVRKVLEDLILFARHYYHRHVPDVRIVPANDELARAKLFDIYNSLPEQFERALSFVVLKQ
jgi:hypothetical protein